MEREINAEMISAMAEHAGRDFFLLHPDAFRQNITGFLEAFRRHYGNSSLAYSYKTNYIPFVCRLAHALGAYAEIVSEMELWIARRVGVPPRRIIYNGPGKSAESLKYCLLHGAKVQVDTMPELSSIRDLAVRHPQREFSIGLRLNLSQQDRSFSRFGFSPESAEYRQALEWIREQKNLRLCGLHTHSSRPDKSPESFREKLRALAACGKGLPDPSALQYLNIGGGFFGRMSESMAAQFGGNIPDFADYGSLVAQEMARLFPDGSMELITEPGVAVAANILDYVVKIMDIRHTAGRTIALTNGTFHNVRPSGHGKKLSLAVHACGRNPRGGQDDFDLAGYTCLENDYLEKGYRGALEIGDFCRFRNVGAYTIVFKPPFIRLAPPIYLMQGDRFQVIRGEERLEDAFRPYCFDPL